MEAFKTKTRPMNKTYTQQEVDQIVREVIKKSRTEDLIAELVNRGYLKVELVTPQDTTKEE